MGAPVFEPAKIPFDAPEQALLNQAGVRILPPAQVTPEAVLAAKADRVAEWNKTLAA